MVLEFLVQQWHLAGALAVAIILLAIHESRRGGTSVSPQQLSRLVNEQEAAVVDLRDPADFRKGHIVGAINLPYAKVDERWDELEKLRERPLILVCKMGQFSSAIGKRLLAKKFPQVYRLGGGIMEWQSAQLPLIKS
jgi:rhodanese-related sulfurtransferase